MRETSASASAANPFVASVARSVLNKIHQKKSSHHRVERIGYSQSKDLWLVSRLNVVSFALSSISCHDAKVLSGNGHDGTSIVSVRVESMLGSSMAGWCC
jgi:hypothetical protein